LEKTRGRVAGEDVEERELLLGQRYFLLADHDLAADRVDHQVADPAGPVAASRAAAQHGADPSSQLLEVEGLRQVIVGTGVEAADAVDLGAAAGQDDHRQARVETRLDPVGLADLAQGRRGRRHRAAQGRAASGRPTVIYLRRSRLAQNARTPSQRW
jgi:hypothetical protein